MQEPLAGLRVLDFGRYIAGPYCATLLADFGADVIRIERREGGEDRYLTPVTSGGEGAMFIGLNRNKRGMTLDPAHPLSREIKRRLIASADVVIANLPVDVLQKLELDYDSLRAIKEDIILVRISTFGPDGPYAERVGFDPVVQAMSGAMSLTGFPPVPVRSVVNFEDFGTALHAAFGALAAVYQRRRTGRGQVVDASLLATGITFMQAMIAEQALLRVNRQAQGNTGFYAAPADVYRAKDGWIVVLVNGNAMFRRWARLVEREDLIDDPRCADDLTRAENAALINEAMSAWTSGRTQAEAVRQLGDARLAGAPVYNLDEVLDDPQVKARELLKLIDYPGMENSAPIPNPAVRLSDANIEIRRRAPMLGEHTDEILRELGFSDDEMDSFRATRVI
ncbi:MAG: CoA transferase [Acidobacteria bacterium]|nr:CoA transferase [Acidobacteriota bacterium]MCW5970431.1 CoA transferase [Blastocatellales bacterium]